MKNSGITYRSQKMMSNNKKISLNSRIVISLIGTLIILGATMQTDNFNFGIMIFLLTFIAVSVAQ